MTGHEIETTSYPADWSQRARLVSYLVIVASLLLVGILFLPLLSATLVAMIIAYALYFPTRFLVARTGWSYRLSNIVVFILFLVVGVIVIVATGIPLLRSVLEFIADLRVLMAEVDQFLRQYTPDQGWLLDNAGNRVFNLNFILEPLSQIVKTGEIPEEFGAVASYLASRFFGVAGSMGSFLLLTLGVLTLAYYMTAELPIAFRWLGGLPIDHRRELTILLSRSAKLWNKYLYSMVVVSLIGGATTWLQLVVMGIGDAVFLSVLSVFIYFIPIFGGYIAGFLVFVGVLINGSSWIQMSPIPLAFFAWVIFVIIQGGIISGVIAPKIFGKSVNFPVTVVIIGLIIFTLVGGFMGALLAVPIMGILREVYSFLLRKMRGGDPYPSVPEPDFVTKGLFAQENRA